MGENILKIRTAILLKVRRKPYLPIFVQNLLIKNVPGKVIPTERVLPTC